jgi:hypothetical protein
MHKKLIALTVFSALAMSSAAFADRDFASDHRDDDRGWRDRDRDRDRDDARMQPRLLASADASARRGSITMSVPKTRRGGQMDLVLVSNDPDLIIRSVVIVDGRGRMTRLRPDRNDDSIELGSVRGIRSVKVQYTNRGRGRDRDASLQLYAKR